MKLNKMYLFVFTFVFVCSLVYSQEVNMTNIYATINSTHLFNYTANYSYDNVTPIQTYWFVNGTLYQTGEDYMNGSGLWDYVDTELLFIFAYNNGTDDINESLNTTIYYPIDLYNQYYSVNVLNQSGNDTNFSVDMYLDVVLAVNFTSTANVSNDRVWYQWFVDGVELIKGWGVNFVNFFFESDDEGIRQVQVNASLSNSTDSENLWSSTLTWTVNVTKPILEPDYIQTDDEVYNSMNIICRHKFTGHVWLYDIDVLVTLENGSREWVKTTETLSTSEFVHFIMRDYQDDTNVTVRCRTFNTYFNYSNYTYSEPIWKKSVNDVNLFRVFNKPIFVGQLNAFETDCDMSKNNKYTILYHWADGNADGTYDKLMSYNETDNVNRSIFLFDTKYIISGNQSINTGCVIKKNTDEVWEFNYCDNELDTCAVQKVYGIEVFD